MVDVEALNLPRREALLTDGRVVPIINLIDADGEETESVLRAISFVCGEGREWWSDLIECYATVTLQ